MKITGVRKPDSPGFAAAVFILTFFSVFSAFAQAQSPAVAQAACGPKEVRFEAITTSGNPPVL
jgi:hypothetical protein